VSSEALSFEIEPAGRRRCAAARAAGDRAGMIRFVLAPDGVVVPDVDERLPGRGIWVAADRALIAWAVRSNLFAKAAGAPARPAVDLPARVEAALRRRCLDLLGLARRAGLLVAGFDQVEAALRQGGIGLLLIARDAASQAAKLRRLAGAVPVACGLGRSELGRPFGREELVYAAVARGRLADRLRRELARLDGLADGTRPEAPGGSETQEGGDDR
jgi:hypothetical protein